MSNDKAKAISDNAPSEGGGGLIVSTASTTSAASCLASAKLTLVDKEVLATLISVARSSFEGCLKVSRNYASRSVNLEGYADPKKRTLSDSCFARSNPSAMTVG